MFQRLLKLLGIIALTQAKENEVLNQTTKNPLVTANPTNSNPSNSESSTDFRNGLEINLEIDEQGNSQNTYLDVSSNIPATKFVSFDPKKSLELKIKADKLFNEKRSQESAQTALDLVNQAIALNPRGEWLNFDKGTYLRRLKRYEEAITAFSAEIALGHNSQSISRSYYERAFVHVNNQNFKQAFADIEAASNNDEEKLLSQPIKSFYQSYSKQLAREIRLETLQAHEKDSAAKIEELIKTTKEIVLKDPLAIPTFGLVAEVGLDLLEQQSFKPHSKGNINFYSSNPTNDNANLGNKNFRNGNYAKAVEYFSNQIDSRHVSWEFFYLRGLSHIALGNNAAAAVDFDDAIDLAKKQNTNYYLAHHNRGIALTNIGLFEEALNDFNTEMTINPNSESVIFRGLLNKHLGHLEESKKDFDSYPEISLKERKKYFPLMYYSIIGLSLSSVAATAIIFFNQMLEQERRNAQPQNEIENNQIHRTNKEEIRGAIKQLSESIFTYLDISEEQKKSFAEISPQQIKEICNDLSQARSANEISEIFSQKYNEKISPELAEFFENIYSQSIAFKTTTNSTNGYPVNFVYNTAIKSERAVSAINQNKLKEYVKIFDELVNEGVETEIAKSATEIVLTEMVSTLVRNLEQQSSVENQIPQTAVTTSEISNLNSQQEGKTL